MAAHSCIFLRRSLASVFGLSASGLHSYSSCSYKALPALTSGSFTGSRFGTSSFLGGSQLSSLGAVLSLRRKHGRSFSLDDDEIAERVRLAVRAAGSRKTGGGRPKVRRKRSVQWAPPAGTAGSDDLIEADVVLEADQALGQVVTSQANFMRVLVEKTGLQSSATAGGEAATAGRDAATAGGGAASFQGSELLCVVRALLKKIRKRVLVGDRVLVSSIDWVEGRGMIEEVVKRKSQLEDPPIANCDHFLVLFALARPPLEPIQLSRFLVAAEYAGVPFTLALNKADLAPPGAAEAWKERLKGWGYNAHILSVEGGEGLEGVFQELSGKTTVVAGPSGAGKSSLINRLRNDSVRLSGATSADDVSGSGDDVSSGEGDSWGPVGASTGGREGSVEVDGGAAVSIGRADNQVRGIDTRLGKDESLAVSAVSAKSGLGRHTTRSIVLIRLPLGGLLADTPGFSLPALSKITEQELPNCFPEVRQRLAAAQAEGRHCAYKDCKHLAEPDCIVSGRAKKSDLDGNGAVMVVEGPDGSLEEREVFQMQEGFEPWERYEDYKQLMAEVKEREDKERWAYGTKRESAVRVRKTDGATGKPKVEPRLAPQKHRRESRKLAKQGLEGLLDEEAMEDEAFQEFMGGEVSGEDLGGEVRGSVGVDQDEVGNDEHLDRQVSMEEREFGKIRAGNNGQGITDDMHSGAFGGGKRRLHIDASAGGSNPTDGSESSAWLRSEGLPEESTSEGLDEFSDEVEEEDFREWLRTREFQYKWWEENDAHMKEDARLASIKSTKDVQRHWRLRKAKLIENRQAVFGERGPKE